MRIFDVIRMCFQNLWRRKVRTMLTVFGVVIGATAIVVMISLGLGVNELIRVQLSTMGDLHIVTVRGAYNGGGGMVTMGGTDSGNQKEPATLNDSAVEKIKAIDGVTAVFPQLNLDQQQFAFYAGKNNRYKSNWVQAFGVDLNEMERFGFPTGGATFAQEDLSKILVFGGQAAYQFRDTKKKRNNSVWPEQKPDGTVVQPFFDPKEETILLTVNNSKKQDESDMYGGFMSGGRGYEHKMTVPLLFPFDQNAMTQDSWEMSSSIYLDINLAKQLVEDYKRLNGVKDKKEISYNSMKVYVEDLSKIKNVQKEIDGLNFSSTGMDSMRESMQGQLKTMQMLLGGLAAISLFVAAIGITNTMIMSIYERTREIGVMKVLGCYIKNIRQTFLMEAGCIGLFGGIVGCALSFGISAILNVIGVSIFGNQIYVSENVAGTVPTSIIPVWLVLLTLAFSTIIGLVSGFGPANRAVKISALEAIKNE